MVTQASQCGCDSGQGLVANPRDRVGRQRLERARLTQIKPMRGKAGVTASAGARQQEALVAALRGGAFGEKRGEDLFFAVVSSACHIKKSALPNDEIVNRHFLHERVLD